MRWEKGRTLLLVASEPQIRVADAAGVGLARVLGVVEDQDVAGGRLGGDDAGVLRHKAGPVHLALVVDLDLDFNLAGDAAESAELSLLVVVVRGVELRVLVGQLDGRDEQVVLLVRGVRAQDEPMDGIVLALGPGHVGQPLGGEGGPLQGVGHHQVIEKGRVLFPDLILLIDDALLHGLVHVVAAGHGRTGTFFIGHLTQNKTIDKN